MFRFLLLVLTCTLACTLACIAPAQASVEEAQLLLQLARNQNGGGRPEEAEQSARSLLAITPNLGEPGRSRLGAAGMLQLGTALRTQGRHAEAEPVLRDALQRQSEAWGKNSSQAGVAETELGICLTSLGRFAESAPLLRSAVSHLSATREGEFRALALKAMGMLARTLIQTGEYEEAEHQLQTAIAAPPGGNALERWRGYAHINMAMLRNRQQRYAEAETHARTGLSVAERILGARHGNTNEALYLLGHALIKQGREEEAETPLRRSVEIQRRQAAHDYGMKSQSFLFLSAVREAKGDLKEAESLLAEGREMAASSGSRSAQLNTLRQYADFLYRHGREAEAQPLFREATDLSDRLFAQTRGVDEASRQQLVQHTLPIYAKAVANLLRLSGKTQDPAPAREALAEVSRTQSRLFTEQLRVASAARFREDRSFRRQDEALAQAIKTETEASRLFTLLGRVDPISGGARLARPSDDPMVRSRQESELRSRYADWTQARTAREEAEAALWRDYPSYMELQAPRPVTVEDLQKRWLRPGEAVLAYFLLQDRVAIFVVTPERFRLVTQPAGRAEITRLVSAVRKPMEQSGINALRGLDPAILHQLYTLLMAPVAADLQGVERLLTVGDGPLHTLPLEMLVTRWGETEQRAYAEAAKKGDLSEYATLDYLGAHHRLSYWPSLAALAYQRGQARSQVRFKRQLVAFADPVFEDGDGGVPAATRAVLSNLGGINRGGIRIPRLPETADEAREAAAILGGRHDVYLREEAREAQAKSMNLSDVRYLHFATHGLLGGEFSLLKAEQEKDGPLTRSLAVVEDDAEVTPTPAKRQDRGQPALVLSLVGNEEGEDGLLSMGEVIERMRLNSDLVILSACNTAGERDSAKSGEGFAGLTRAFMHAGARGLLVSHWSVESQATKDLVVDTFRHLKAGEPAHQALGRARDLLRQGRSTGLGVSQAHPFFWAPFVHVGD